MNRFFAKSSPQVYNTQLFKKDEKYDFITHDSTYYYMYLKQPNLMPFSNIVDWFFKSDLVKVEEYMNQSNNMLVFDEITRRRFKELLDNYILERDNGIMFIYRRKN